MVSFQSAVFSDSVELERFSLWVCGLVWACNSVKNVRGVELREVGS